MPCLMAGVAGGCEGGRDIRRECGGHGISAEGRGGIGGGRGWGTWALVGGRCPAFAGRSLQLAYRAGVSGMDTAVHPGQWDTSSP